MKHDPKPIFDNKITLLALSMGKAFPVKYIAADDDEANAICKRDSDVAVIAVDKSGRVYLAEQYGPTVPSSTLSSLF